MKFIRPSFRCTSQIPSVVYGNYFISIFWIEDWKVYDWNPRRDLMVENM